MGSILVNHSVTVAIVLLAWRLFLQTSLAHVEGLQSHHLYLVVRRPLHASILARFLSLVVISLLIAATLVIAHRAQSP